MIVKLLFIMCLLIDIILMIDFVLINVVIFFVMFFCLFRRVCVLIGIMCIRICFIVYIWIIFKVFVYIYMYRN